MVVYGLPSCGTTKAAVAALRAAGHEVIFRDVRQDPLSQPERERFHAAFGDRLLNRASTTWRSLDESERAMPAPDLIARHPAVMKRPVIEAGDSLLIGWTDEVRAALA